jgi:hypothetical protein
MKKTQRRVARSAIALPCLALMPVLPLGCTHQEADLRLTCLESNKTFTQQFKHAYVGKDESGNTHAVLLSDERDANVRIRQVMHVKILWRPQYGVVKAPDASFTNASVNWYVVSGKSEVLEYSGAGFVAMSKTATGQTEVTIRDATLKPVRPSAGSLTDPVGPAKLDGSFVAKKDSKRVNEVLAEVNQALNAINAQHASAR